MRPEPIRVLIAEDNEKFSNAIKRSLEKMLDSLSLNVKVNFCQLSSKKDVKYRIKNEIFNLIILDEQLKHQQSGLSLIPDIKQHNPEAIVCFLSSNPTLVEKAKINTDVRIMCFDKDVSARNGYSGIIRSEDLEEIRKTFMLKHKNLLGILT